MGPDPQPADTSAPNTNNQPNQEPAAIYPQATHGFGTPPPEFLNKAAVYDQPVASSQPPLMPNPVTPDLPVAVVQALSVRGVEYTMMTLALLINAGALIWSLLSVVNGGTSFSLLAFPIALLIVCGPVFAFFFLRLRKSELTNPALRFDASKRRLSQFTQIIAFATCLFNTIGFVYLVLQKISGGAAPSIVKSIINLGVVLAIAGGILVYYWFDEHRGA